MAVATPDIQSNIQEFFKNKSVFVTGGTGFLGKLIVNKLIRSCPQIKHIYLLVRDKKGKSAHERLEDIFNMPIFKDINSTYLKKISAFSGDCSHADLGLSIENLNTLVKEVNVIFHSAATVRFDERLDIAIGINVIGAREIVKLAHKMENLESYLHVSTAFSNCHKKHIDEKFYDLPYNYEKLIHLYKTKSSNILEKMKPFLLGPMPNTYVMTKAAAEQLIKHEAVGLPVTIFRPAIVIATAKEPLPGWIDNLYGPTGIVTGVMTGIIKALPCEIDAGTDLVPADLTVNALIAASWDTNIRHLGKSKLIEKCEDDPWIYNFVSSPENPLTWGTFSETLMYHILHRPTAKAMWYPTLIVNASMFLHKLTVLILHYLPAFLLDLVFIVRGKKLRLVDQYKKIGKFTDILEYFSTREWIFSNKNVHDLWDRLNKDDKTLFPFDIKQMHWNEYLDTYHKGIMTFLLKEGPDKLPAAKKRLRGLYICHMIFKGAVYIGLMMFFWMIIKKIFLV
ncbi:fatty acyl-CoA reductase wat-like [Sipha flava]|uniref:Fatty acyl-CoA reductase n=2 Tax=Sipha flava TaxID=143950 RepID=A0A2S2QDY8_9HEMI|nr:fatty acyl-CoA reductase wat-like [Sipha flava]XP_025424318.1 fatty acyl-CoA reductase wat-like [Sipha flava]XP_025424319.1 fatty acyl-CoA reductase wat-like [Sipha flava]XP_025424320.1 fatty acyl-CoA reductase wat-like [Sipha flava]